MLELCQLEVPNPTQSVVGERGNTLSYFSKKSMGRFSVKVKSKDKNNVTKEISQGERLDAGQAKTMDVRQYLADG